MTPLPQVLVPPPRPTCCKDGTPGQCELATLTASQISAALILFSYVIIRIYVVMTAKNDPIAVQTTTASAVTILYIFFCFWLVEEELVDDLRELRPLFSWSEFVFRIVLLIAISLMPNFIEHWIPNVIQSALAYGYPAVAQGGAAVKPTMSLADPIVLFLAILYLMFLFWDGLIFFGAPTTDPTKRSAIRATAKTFLKTDCFGLFILILVEALRFIYANGASFCLLVFIVFSVWQIKRVYTFTPSDRLHRRLKRRLLLR